MDDEYQQDGVGSGPLGCMNLLTCRINVHDRLFNVNWTLEAPKKQLYHNCRKQVVSA